MPYQYKARNNILDYILDAPRQSVQQRRRAQQELCAFIIAEQDLLDSDVGIPRKESAALDRARAELPKVFRSMHHADPARPPIGGQLLLPPLNFGSPVVAAAAQAQAAQAAQAPVEPTARKLDLN